MFKLQLYDIGVRYKAASVKDFFILCDESNHQVQADIANNGEDEEKEERLL